MFSPLKIQKALVALCVCFSHQAAALDLPANAIQTQQDMTQGDVQFPTGPYDETAPKFLSRAGQVNKQSFRISGTSKTSFQLIDALRAQLEADGYKTQFVCADSVCGGFDFRFSLDLFTAPDMQVDLGDFQYLVATKGDKSAVSLLVSRMHSDAYAHITEVSTRPDPIDTPPEKQTDSTEATALEKPFADTVQSDLVRELISNGRVALDDLVFETGAAALGSGPFDSIKRLAQYLNDNPNVRVVLVGHTDNIGGLDGNIRLSKKRADAVRRRLIDAHNVAAEQAGAQGVGYLVPRGSNETEQGRENNRRVEAVIASTR